MTVSHGWPIRREGVGLGFRGVRFLYLTHNPYWRSLSQLFEVHIYTFLETFKLYPISCKLEKPKCAQYEVIGDFHIHYI